MAKPVWLTLDNGRVWSVFDGGKPKPTDWVCASPFDARGDSFLDGDVYVPGYRHNSVLICSLLSSLRDGSRLHVCGPRFLDCSNRDVPAVVLNTHVKYRGPSAPSASGPRRISKRDFPAFFIYYWYARIVGRVALLDGATSLESDYRTAAVLLERHPATCGMRFLGMSSDPHLLLLLGFLGEPRWYRLPRKPNKLRMDSALGVSMEMAARNFSRGSSWLAQESLIDFATDVSGSDAPQAAWLRLRFDRADNFERGLVEVMRATLRYLDSLWVAVTDRALPLEQLFVPSTFIKDEASIKLYATFATGLRRPD